jgi:predicted XRE-type DNA-binding protein
LICRENDLEILEIIVPDPIILDLRSFIEAKKLTQAQAAQMLGVSQSRVSDLVRGKWEKFSLEMLITLATRAGMHISLSRAA